MSRSGVLFAEFDAPELPRFNLVGARFTRNFVNGEYDTETPSVREDYAHDLPCYKAEEISGFVEPCPPSPDRPVVLNGSYCQQHADAMKRRVQTLSKDLLGLQTAFENGDLNVGKYMGEAVLNEQDTALIVTAAVAAGFFALATGGAGTFAAAATVTAVASTLGSEKEVDPPDPVPVYPESLVESMFRAIDAQALQCSLDMMTPGVHYCQTAPGEEREGHAFTRLGPAQNSFTKALYQNEFAFSDSPQDQTAQRKGGNPFANTPYGQSFPPDPSRVRAQYAAGLSESESRSVNAQRARIVTGSANNVERVMEEGRKVHYYDCTTELKDNVCIDPGIPLHAGNLNKNIHTSAGVSRVNGENGCLWAGLAVGEFNCAWYFDDGLRDDLHRLLCLATDDANGCDGARMAQVQANNVQCPDGFLFTSPVSGLPISRGLDCQRLAVVEDIVTYLDDQRQPRVRADPCLQVLPRCPAIPLPPLTPPACRPLRSPRTRTGFSTRSTCG